MKKATKALKIAPGDASNPAVRCVLKTLSKQLFGPIGDKEIELVFKFFNYKCPYTGKNLKPAYLKNNKPKVYDMDHIIGQNKDDCGLNALGNILFVDSAANNAKKRIDYKTFLKTNTTVLGNLPDDVRKARIKKIEDYQKYFGYDQKKYKVILSPLLNDFYNKISNDVEEKADELCKLIYALNNDSIVKLDKYEQTLLDNGYSNNTAYAYRNAVAKILKEDKIQINDFEKNIIDYALKNSGKQDHDTTKNALVQYRKLILKHPGL